ncbi:alpha/beta hydrolase [soil metagenome]
MASLDGRVRLLKFFARTSIADMDIADIARAQGPLKRNRLVDQLLGSQAAGVEVYDSFADGAELPLRLRIYRPAKRASEPLPMIVNFHGGGFVVGSLEQCDWLCSNVAAALPAVVLSIGYRTAPAHRRPAAAEDCYAAFSNIASRASEFGGNPGRLTVLGDSAGGNLAAVVALMARDRSGPQIANQVLIYPITDMTLTSPSVEENAHAPVLSKRDIVACCEHYLGGQDPHHPYASPLLAPDLRGLPPALIQIAEHDPVRDDGLRYGHALRAAGVPVRTTNYVGMPHGFLAFPTLCRSAPQALAEVCATLAETW